MRLYKEIVFQASYSFSFLFFNSVFKINLLGSSSKTMPSPPIPMILSRFMLSKQNFGCSFKKLLRLTFSSLSCIIIEFGSLGPDALA